MTTVASAKPCLFHVLHHDGAGGGPACVSELVDMWSDQFHQVVITGGRGSLGEFCRGRNIPCHSIGLHRRLFLPWAALRLAVLLRRYRPEAVVLTGQWAGIMAPVARAMGAPVVIYIVQFSFLYTDRDIYRVVRNYLIEWISCRFSDRVVALSPGNRYQYILRGMAVPPKLRLIPNAFSPRRVPPPGQAAALRARLGWTSDRCHVVSVGRLEDQKRVDWLLRSWAIVESAGQSVHLWIVGSGREEGSLRKLAVELGLKNCTFLGAQPNGIDFVAAADVVAMTSLYEMHAVIPMEAMACGRPIVASAVDGVRFTFHSGVEGLLVPPGDVNAFAQALLSVIGDEGLRVRMGAAGRRRVDLFAPGIVQLAYRELFVELGIEKP